MTRHTITAGCPLGDSEIEVVITFEATPGEPERGPSYASGGEPATDGELEFVDWQPGDPGVVRIPHRWEQAIDAWGREWLASDRGQELAWEEVTRALEDDR